MIPASLKNADCKDGVDTGRAHAGLDTDLNTVDGVEVDLVVSDELLHLSRQGASPALRMVHGQFNRKVPPSTSS